jgi:hypothetical protein
MNTNTNLIKEIGETALFLFSTNPEYFLDCGEVQFTQLAEEVAQTLSLYEGDDFEIPEIVFEIVAGIEYDI